MLISNKPGPHWGRGDKKNGSGNNPEAVEESEGANYLLLIQSNLLNADVVASHFQVEIHPVGAGGGGKITNAILVATFTAGAFVYLAERFWLVGVKKGTQYLGGFGLRINLLLILNGNFYVVRKILGKRFNVTRI